MNANDWDALEARILDYTPLELDFETWAITRFREGRIARIEFHVTEDRVHASLDAG